MRVVSDNITHTNQRPPSVGMPRHALRRRMPNSATGRPHLLGAGVFFTFEEVARVGRAPGALRCPCVYILENLKKKLRSRELS